jgi:hypothetical protein
MNHDLIVDTIIKNNGIIIGGYVREWLGNGTPSDTGWKDIDIKCPQESEFKIRKELYDIYPKLFLDFSPNAFFGYRSPYSCNLIQYDGEFKTVKCLGEQDYVDSAKNKICIYLKKTSLGRKLNFEQRLINDGWKIEFPYFIKR